MDSCQNAPDSTGDGVFRNWGVSDREVCFFFVAAPIDYEINVLGPSGRPSVKRSFDQRFEDIPDFMPNLCNRAPNRQRVFRPQNGGICVVINTAKFGSPPKQLGKT